MPDRGMGSNAGPALPRGPLLLAHRGDHGRAPENSLAAFRAALARPACDGLELDVRHSADGLPVILHDRSLARVQGRPERAADLPAAELAVLGVPLLADLLAICPPGAFLDVELKEVPTVATLAPLRSARENPDGGLAAVVLSSFDPTALDAARDLAPGWPRWLNVEGTFGLAEVDAALALGCAAIAADWRLITPATAGLVREAALDLAAWTVRRRATLRRLAALDVVAACVEGAALPG